MAASCSIGCRCGLDSTPGSGTSVCCRCSHKKKKIISLIINETEQIICLRATYVFRFLHMEHISVFRSFLLPKDIPLCGYTTLYLFIYWVMDICFKFLTL